MSVINKIHDDIQKISYEAKTIKTFAWLSSSLFLLITMWIFYFKRNIILTLSISSLTALYLLIALLHAEYLQSLYKIWMMFIVIGRTFSLWMFSTFMYYLFVLTTRVSHSLSVKETMIKRLERMGDYWQQKKNVFKNQKAIFF